MFKVALRGLAAHRLRLALTALAVVLGVGFIAGTFVITDTMNKAFDELFASSTQGIDVIVRADESFAQDNEYGAKSVPETIVHEVREVEGVKAAEGSVQGFAQLVDENGEAITPNGPPALGLSWSTEVKRDSFRLVGGRASTAAGEVVVDEQTARDHGLSTGDSITIIFARGASAFEIVGDRRHSGGRSRARRRFDPRPVRPEHRPAPSPRYEARRKPGRCSGRGGGIGRAVERPDRIGPGGRLRSRDRRRFGQAAVAPAQDRPIVLQPAIP